MKSLIIAVMAGLLATSVFAQNPVASVGSIGRVGTTVSIDNAAFSLYNSVADTTAAVTIVSSDTDVFTVSPASASITTGFQTVTITFATDLSEGNYSGNVVVTQADPAKVINVPVTLRVTRDNRNFLGSMRVDVLRDDMFDALVVATPVIDVSTTTSITAYKPRRIGDVLIGRTAAETAAVWVAVGTTTNDWSKIGPAE